VLSRRDAGPVIPGLTRDLHDTRKKYIFILTTQFETRGARDEPPRSRLRGIKGEDIFFIPLTLTLSHQGEREQKVTLQRATGNYQVKLEFFDIKEFLRQDYAIIIIS